MNLALFDNHNNSTFTKELLLLSLLEYVCKDIHKNDELHNMILNHLLPLIESDINQNQKNGVINYLKKLFNNNQYVKIIEETDNTLVYKSHNKIDNQNYAIKKVEYNDENLKEIEILAHMDNKNIISPPSRAFRIRSRNASHRPGADC